MIDLAEATPVLRRNVQRDGARAELENLQAWRRLARAFASALIDWDLFDGGVPVPATFAGVMSLGLDEVMELVGGWRQAMTRRPAVDEAEPDEADDTDLDADLDAEGDDGEGALGADGVDEEWLAQLPVTVPSEPSPAADPAPLPEPEAEAAMADA